MYDEDFRLSTFNLGNWLKSVVLGQVVACSANMRGDLGSILGEGIEDTSTRGQH